MCQPVKNKNLIERGVLRRRGVLRMRRTSSLASLRNFCVRKAFLEIIVCRVMHDCGRVGGPEDNEEYVY